MKAVRLPSGNWSVNVYLGTDPNGKQIRRRFTGPDKRSVIQAAAEFSAEHREAASACSLRSAAEAVLSRTDLSPSTIHGYRTNYKYLENNEPALLRTSCYAIRREDIQSMIERAQRAGKAPKTIRNIYGFICSCMKSQHCAMPVVDLPPKERPDYHIPDDITVRRTLNAAKQENMELWICIALAAFGPLRAGEIAALSYTYDDDVDFVHSTIHVSHDYVCGDGGTYTLKEPKTPSSNRIIVMPQWIMDAIRKQGYVTHWNGHQIYNRFSKLLKKYDIPHYRFHDLRHYCASYLHAKGYPDAYIQARTGHASNEVLRQVYTHVLDSEQREITAKMLADFDKVVNENVNETIKKQLI